MCRIISKHSETITMQNVKCCGWSRKTMSILTGRKSPEYGTWMRPPTTNFILNCKPIKDYKRAGLRGWGCMFVAGVGRMYNVADTLKMDHYLGILLNTMKPRVEDLFGDQMCIFQHDNDPKHTTNATKLQAMKVFVCSAF